MVSEMDRRLLLGLVPAACGVALGLAAAIVPAPGLAVGAAACALMAGGATLATTDQLRRHHAAAGEARAAATAQQAELNELRAAVAASREAAEAAAHFAEMVATHQLETDATANAAAATAAAAMAAATTATEAAAGAEAPTLQPHDAGLLDESYFPVALDQRIANARRQLEPVSLLLINLDSDGVGDGYRTEAISSFVQTLRETMRDCDTACRLGPTSFAVILEDTPEAGGVWAAERLRMAMLRKGGSLLRFSAAVAAYPSHALDADEVRQRAERALAVAEASGSNHVEVASPE